MTTWPIGCGQLTWRPERDTDADHAIVLREIADAGYDGAPAPASGPERAAREFAEAGLRPAPGYLGARFWDRDARDEILARAREQVATSQALGVTELYAAASLTPERRLLAGHVSPEDALAPDALRIFAGTLSEVGRIAQDHGVALCFHHHVGSFIETRAELDQLFALVDREVVFLGPDFGHLVWAGDDPLALIRDYGTAIRTVHIKDLNREVLDRGVAATWDYATFSANGLFTELGTGFIDYRPIFAALTEQGFDGWVIVETDVTQLPTARESATISRAYLRNLGI